jgi:hypothetical protein
MPAYHTGLAVGRDSQKRVGAGSIPFDARRLDNRPPSLDLGPLNGAKCHRRLLFARRNLLAQIGELDAHFWIGQGVRDGAIDLADDVPWRRGHLTTFLDGHESPLIGVDRKTSARSEHYRV